MKNQEKQQEFKKTIEFIKSRLEIYNERLIDVRGKKRAFVYKVNDVYALRFDDAKGYCELCSPAEASLFNQNGISQIKAQANFKDLDGKPIKPFGEVLAETYFSDMAKEAGELLQILEQTFNSLEGAEK